MTDDTTDPAVPIPPSLGGTPLGEAAGPSRLCNFCHNVYFGKTETCTHCGKKFPKMPTG